jgi:type IV pilus assembly protein PilB
MARKKIGEMLIEAGLLDQTGLRAALVEQRRWGGPLGRILIDMKLVNEDQLVAALSRQLGIPTIDIDKMSIAPSIIDLVPGELAEQHSLVPFAQPMKFLDVAMSDPTNLGIIDELRIRTQLNVRPYLAGPKALERAIAHYYGRGFGQMSSGSRPASVAGGMMEFEAVDAERPMEVVHGSGSRVVETPRLAGTVNIGLPQPGRAGGRDAEIEALQARISKLEALVQRDEDVLRKLLGLLVEKGVASREESLDRIR